MNSLDSNLVPFRKTLTQWHAIKLSDEEVLELKNSDPFFLDRTNIVPFQGDIYRLIMRTGSNDDPSEEYTTVTIQVREYVINVINPSIQN